MLIQILPELKNIKMLYANGNPCSLITGYREVLLQKVPTLLILDDIKKLSERELRKKMKEQFEKDGMETSEIQKALANVQS